MKLATSLNDVAFYYALKTVYRTQLRSHRQSCPMHEVGVQS